MLLEGITNFKCQSSERSFIQHFVIDTLAKHIRNIKAASKVGGSVSTNAYNMQFSSNQSPAAIVGKKQALKSNVKSKESSLDYELSGIKPGTAAAEFDMNEICDY